MYPLSTQFLTFFAVHVLMTWVSEWYQCQGWRQRACIGNRKWRQDFSWAGLSWCYLLPFLGVKSGASRVRHSTMRLQCSESSLQLQAGLQLCGSWTGSKNISMLPIVVEIDSELQYYRLEVSCDAVKSRLRYRNQCTGPYSKRNRR